MNVVTLLISDKRSGSTVFQRELCRHPDISHVEYSPHTHYETHHWLKGAVMLGMPPDTFSGGKRYPGYGSAKNARTYLIDCVKGNVPDYEVRAEGKELVFDAWEALCEKYSNPVFFEKSPQYIANWASLSLLLEWIERTHRKVKIIGLTRNPMSVMHSAQELFHTSPAKRQFGWLELQQNLLALQAILPAENYMQCRYEDIIANPVEEFSRVCLFLGVAENDQIGTTVHRDSLEKWREDQEFDFILDDTVKQMARHFGYSDQEMENPGKQAALFPRKVARAVTRNLKLRRSRIVDRFLKPVMLRGKK